MNKLLQDPQLVHHQDSYQGKLVMPYGYGVVLSNITRKQFNKTDLGEVLPLQQVIYKDEMLATSPKYRKWASGNSWCSRKDAHTWLS